MLGKWEGGSELRSPSALRSKVLIKGSNHVANSIELLEDMEEMRVEIQKGATLTKEEIAFLEEKMAEKTNRPDDEESEKEKEFVFSLFLFLFFFSALDSHISSELEALIYLRAKKLPKFPLGYDSFQPNFMTSFGENRINKILRDNDGIMHLRAFNAKHISRVYPKGISCLFVGLFICFSSKFLMFFFLKGTRFDSSNYDPGQEKTFSCFEII